MPLHGKALAQEEGSAAERIRLQKQLHVAVRMTAAGEGKGRCALGQAAGDLAFSNPL